MTIVTIQCFYINNLTYRNTTAKELGHVFLFNIHIGLTFSDTQYIFYLRVSKSLN